MTRMVSYGFAGRVPAGAWMVTLVAVGLAHPALSRGASDVAPNGHIELPAGGILEQHGPLKESNDIQAGAAGAPIEAATSEPSASERVLTVQDNPPADPTAQAPATADPDGPEADAPAGDPAVTATDSAEKVVRREPPSGAASTFDPAATGEVLRRETGMRSWPIWEAVPLLAVLGLIGVAAYFVKRHLPARNMLMGGQVLQVVARLPVSSKQSLVLVKMGRRLILTGVSGEQISTLCVVDDPDQVATLTAEAASGQPDSIAGAFSDAYQEAAHAYAEEGTLDDDHERETAGAVDGGQVQGLLKKVRQLRRGPGVV